MELEMEFGPAIIGLPIVVIVRVVVLLLVHLIGMMVSDGLAIPYKIHGLMDAVYPIGFQT